MARSQKRFHRWKSEDESTWVFRVFKQHNFELTRMYTSFENAHKYTYKKLREGGADWNDFPTKHFDFIKHEYEQYNNLKEWSDSFNDLKNWINLNALITISSNFETYLSTVIPLALSSDIGLLYGVSHKIDGIVILKYGHERPFDFNDIVIGCTKGDWSSRLATYEKTFSKSPKILADNISSLETLRRLRNDVAHAFGRDIEASRNHQEIKTLPIKRLSRERLLKFQRLVWEIAKSIDIHLHQHHIGEYQAVLFYHEIFPKLDHNSHPSERAMVLKKRIGNFGATPLGKEFCKGLVKYYEAL